MSEATDIDATPTEIELPVCPRCGQVGRVVGQKGRTKFDCTGPRGHLHKRTKMVHRRFRMVNES